MAGPTPVSALIHAATMVTAGIYMILRMHFLFVLATDTNLLIAAVGAATSLLAALIATSQNDIKKVLAYSTVSQLGLMFLGLGTGAYLAAFFHLMTHAFFKALLFLGAGSVIHALGGEQDIGKMGALRKKLPWTFLTFSIATLAIAGIPPFAGFFSKDALLYGSLGGPYGTALWATGSLASLLTAFYMARLYTLVFFGESGVSHDVHADESPAVMTIPLMILAVGSALAGFLGMPEGFHLLPNYLGEFPGTGDWNASGASVAALSLRVRRDGSGDILRSRGRGLRLLALCKTEPVRKPGARPQATAHSFREQVLCRRNLRLDLRKAL